MEEENSIQKELSNIQKEFAEFKAEFKKMSELTLREANRKISERPFGMLFLPSKGLFYKNKNKYLLVGYLTYFEESILTSEMMQESNIAMPIILEKVIMNNDFDIKEILSCDVQAISMFLRAFSYGDSIEVELECPHCNKKDKHTIRISSFKSKDLDVEPNNDGEFELITPIYNKNIKIRPKTYFEELQYQSGGKSKNIDDMCFYLTEFEGERDKRLIKQKLLGLKILESRDVKKTIFDNLPGIDTTVSCECMFCDKEIKVNFGSNGADFLKLPASMINGVLEEIFLLNHYGEGITIEDAKKLPVSERRWMINRLSEELEKKKKAEEAAVRNARSKRK